MDLTALSNMLVLTHLSDFSYLERGVHEALILGWAIYRISTTDGWSGFNWRALRTFQLKMVATCLILLSLGIMVCYDTIVSLVKYEEGYAMNAANGRIALKASTAYSLLHKSYITVADSLLDVAWSFKASSMFMLLATFNYITTENGSVHASFMGSWEFRAYRIYSILSMFAYGMLQGIFSYNPLLTAVVPQFVYHTECFAIFWLLLLTNYRINRLTRTLTNPTTIARMQLYATFNYYLAFSLLLDFTGLFIINTDILVGHKDVQNSKFWTDILTVVFNAGFCLDYIFMLLVLYPPDISTAAANTRTTNAPVSRLPTPGGGRTGAGATNQSETCPTSQPPPPPTPVIRRTTTNRPSLVALPSQRLSGGQAAGASKHPSDAACTSPSQSAHAKQSNGAVAPLSPRDVTLDHPAAAAAYFPPSVSTPSQQAASTPGLHHYASASTPLPPFEIASASVNSGRSVTASPSVSHLVTPSSPRRVLRVHVSADFAMRQQLQAAVDASAAAAAASANNTPVPRQ